MNPWWMAAPTAAAAGLTVWAARHPSAQLFGPTIRYTGRVNSLALTFDDGPNPNCTPRLLNLLERFHARATFFMIGKYVRRDPGLAREVAARGHLIGNHTDTHPSLIWLSPAQIETELRPCDEALDAALGAGRASSSGKWMRPPYGSRGPQLNRVARRMGFDGVVMWSLMGYDWKPQPPETLIGRLAAARWNLRGGRGGDVITLHDGWSRGWNADREHLLKALE
ncbi:MAG TPA: polysaccharide deacetylase family protein, partial [Candidatus Acidoferrales bacterium]|nr:polysaccharide deacetylase family protein [Candidatus Acidoferrales bacterium]